jgi:hypothetical protein
VPGQWGTQSDLKVDLLHMSILLLSHCTAVFRDNEAPRYTKAFVAHIVIYGVQLIAIIFLRGHLMRQNVLKRRAQAKKVTKTSGEDSVRATTFSFHKVLSSTCHQDENIAHNRAFEDLTDKENPDCKPLTQKDL